MDVEEYGARGMSSLLPLVGLFKNLKQEIPITRRREYLTRDDALEQLKRLTGKNFGFNIEEWNSYLSSIDFNLNNLER